MLNVIKFFSKVGTYPIELAKHLGIDKSALLWDLIRKYGDTPFPIVSVNHYKTSSWFELVEDNYIITDELGHRINFTKLESLIPSDDRLPQPKPPFEDDTFKNLCARWFNILKEKGRRKTITQIYKLFEGKTRKESIEALHASVNNRWVTLFFDEDTKGDDQKPRNSGGTRDSGGSKNTTEVTDHSHLVRKLGEF